MIKCKVLFYGVMVFIFTALLFNVAYTQSKELHVKAFIDGNSILFIKGDKVWWQNIGGCKPGKWSPDNGPGNPAQSNEPTYINGNSWIPEWSNSAKMGGKDESKPFTVYGLNLSPSISKIFISTKEARCKVEIKKMPNPKNPSDTSIGVVFNDPEQGAAWYDIIIKW